MLILPSCGCRMGPLATCDLRNLAMSASNPYFTSSNHNLQIVGSFGEHSSHSQTSIMNTMLCVSLPKYNCSTAENLMFSFPVALTYLARTSHLYVFSPDPPSLTVMHHHHFPKGEADWREPLEYICSRVQGSRDPPPPWVTSKFPDFQCF